MSSLSRAEAVERAGLVRVDSYRVDLDLAGAHDQDTFVSTCTVAFQADADTFVELKPVQLIEVRLNGTPLELSALRDNRLPLTGLTGQNELTFQARMGYSHSGEGLHRFVDPEDGETYLYAQSFLDDAQRIFPCLDQPDLKAAVTLSVTAPTGWEVAGNAAGVQSEPGRWIFEPTAPMSTYLFSLIAGPYHVRRTEHDGIPLALYCRRSLAPHLDKDVDEIFEITAASFDRCHELFGVRYPFGKYDQAFVPEFNAGAMENVGLVTLRDEYVFRSAVTDAERELRAETIAHEMAHMWFGDLVTMRWWDDLWLNESFAEYLGYRVVADATRFRDAWTGFAGSRKGWGYAADQRPSTHPVAPESVVDTAHALLNFDGISYAKGAAALRQLAAWIGDEAFLTGLRAHIQTHAYGNATLADLLDALATASGRDLTAWAEVWLRTPQVNTLWPIVSVGPDGTYESVHIEQTAPASHPTLRPHRIGVGLFDRGIRRQSVSVDLPAVADTPVPELSGEPVGDLILLNDGDLTFAKIRFDPTSLAALPETLTVLAEPLARALVWAAAADAVRDAWLPAEEFVRLLEAGLPAESQLSVLRDLTRFATSRAADAGYVYAGVLGRCLPPERVAAVERRVAATCRAAMDRARDSGVQLLAALGFVGAAGADDVPELRRWLAGETPAGLVADPDLRWAVMARLAVLGDANEADIDAEYEGDRTASGAVQAVRCRASRPDPAAKRRAWETIVADATSSNRLVAAAAEGFWCPGQDRLTESYVERYFDEMPAVARLRTPMMTIQVAASGFPRYAANPSTIQRAEELLRVDGLDPALRRVVVDGTDELRRTYAARELGVRAQATTREPQP
jgi:aminopeptidase N